MNVRKVLAGSAAATAVMGIGLFGVASPAQADTCPKTRNVSVTGGRSSYTISCSGGNVYVDGRVYDTNADGHCVEVKTQINSSFYYDKVCGEGNYRSFNHSGSGNTAYVWTYRL